MLKVFVNDINGIVPELKKANADRNSQIEFIFNPDAYSRLGIPTWCKYKIPKANTKGFCSFSWNYKLMRACQENDAVTTLVNSKMDFVFFDAQSYKGFKYIFVDDGYSPNLPDAFHRYPSFACYSDILQYGISNSLIPKFSLDDKKCFKKLNGKQFQGQPIYKELNTGCYWYLDNLHKNHYEVFDPTGDKHLAEASLDGIPDYSKADPRHVSIKKYI